MQSKMSGINSLWCISAWKGVRNRDEGTSGVESLACSSQAHSCQQLEGSLHVAWEDCAAFYEGLKGLATANRFSSVRLGFVKGRWGCEDSSSRIPLRMVSGCYSKGLCSFV